MGSLNYTEITRKVLMLHTVQLTYFIASSKVILSSNHLTTFQLQCGYQWLYLYFGTYALNTYDEYSGVI